MDDEFREYHGRVWANAMEMAESFATVVFTPDGHETRAVLVNDLVRLRRMPSQAEGE
jgi:hypothetical protein